MKKLRGSALIYQAKGLPEDEAQALAKRLITDKASALDTMAREELGIDPKELGGSAGAAAGASFCLFALGAIVAVFLFVGARGCDRECLLRDGSYVWHRRWNYLTDWTEPFLLRSEADHLRVARGRDHFRPRTGDWHFLEMAKNQESLYRLSGAFGQPTYRWRGLNRSSVPHPSDQSLGGG
jgi:hypothetical protein